MSTPGVAPTTESRQIGAKARHDGGRLEGLLCAALGMLVALAFLAALVGITGAVSMLVTWSPPIAAAAVTLVLVVFAAAPLAARRILAHGSRFAGPGLALASFVMASVAGASAARVVYGPGPHAVGGILLPVFWVVVFGGMPALLLGLLFDAMVRRRAAGERLTATRKSA